MPCPDIVRDAVARYASQRNAYRSKGYNETQLRRDFLDPFLEGLGWDVANRHRIPEPFREVVQEDRLVTEGSLRAPDYSIRVGGSRKFFVEAKKPSVNLLDDVPSAFQLRRYGWSAKLSLSALANFEHFVAFDCRLKPEPTDRPSKGRVLAVPWSQYEDRWDEIVDLFGRDAVLAGSIDEFEPPRRGVVEVDDAFLQEMESWREWLAHDIHERNPDLPLRDLNWLVQRTIDRIVFLRICEARGIEELGRLRETLSSESVYGAILQLYERADERYDSGLFHFTPDTSRPSEHDSLSFRITVSDGVLGRIIGRLYYPQSPYEFSVLPPEILGQVYERFLGKTVHIDGPTVTVEEKPEVRKAGGVYYTPTHIVEFIVRETLGQLVEQYRPGPKGGVSRLRVLDPACGSGSFLLGVYDFLLDWHLEQYLRERERYQDMLLPLENGEWRLTTDERKRILLNNVWGVDIDPQAVEVTKLSLLLKVLEGEDSDSLDRQFALFHERALPDLDRNIRCGNSLVGSEFFADEQFTLLDPDHQLRVNPFDWSSEFLDIMNDGGFHVVLGNPPYVFGEFHDDAVKEYLETNYETAQGQYDTYKLFLEKALYLTRNGGKFGMIVPDAILARDEGEPVRRMLLAGGMEATYHCGMVFDANVSAVVVSGTKGETPARIQVFTREGTQTEESHTCARDRFVTDRRARFLVHSSDEEARTIAKLEGAGTTLGEAYISMSRGEEVGKKHTLPEGRWPILVGEDVSRFRVRSPSRFVNDVRKDPSIYVAPKIVIVKTGDTVVAALDEEGWITMQSLYNLHVRDGIDEATIVGVLNSQVVEWFIRRTFTDYKLLFPQLNQTTILDIPAPVDLRERGRPVADLVRRLMEVEAGLEEKRLQDRAVAERWSKELRKQIDGAVAELYGLGEEEYAVMTAG